jgi:hypothetical protein
MTEAERSAREPGHCPLGHPCEVTGIYIKCPRCGWMGDSNLADLFSPQGGFVSGQRPGR